MQLNTKNLCAACIILASCQPQTTPSSQPTAVVKAPRHLGDALHWYDGTTRRKTWIDTQRVAEFRGNVQTEELMLRMFPQAQKTAEHTALRIWGIGEGTDVRAVELSLHREFPEARFSALLYRSAHGQGVQALPGGMIVTLSPELSEKQAALWLEQREHSVLRKLSPIRNVFLVDTPSGIASLKAANQLHESGEVVSASPNWWQPAVLK